MSLPKTEISGNAISDAKTGIDKNGQRYCFVTVGCSESHSNDDGTWTTDKSIYFNVKLFQASDDLAIPKKGDRVVAYGKLHQTMDTMKDGNPIKNINLDAEFIKTYPRESLKRRKTKTDNKPIDYSQNYEYGSMDEEPPF